MKWMIASDLHGSAYYCKKMLEDFEKEKADRLILLGDLLYHGPRNELPKDYDPKKVAGMLNAIKDRIFCVRGNCDSEVDQMMLEFGIMADYALLEFKGHVLFLTHGHQYNLEHLPSMQPGDILVHGHTHVPAWQPFGQNQLYLNPGSISIPKQNSLHSYMIIGEDAIRWKSLEMETFHEMHL